MIGRGLSAVGLLICSNLFMTLAWYGQVMFKSKFERIGLVAVIFISWLVAFFEYCFMVPANHIGRSVGLSLAQLKIMQEVITVCVFIPFMILFMGERWRWDYLWALLCMVGAVYFVNRHNL